jgi:hypothetical protein
MTSGAYRVENFTLDQQPSTTNDTLVLSIMIGTDQHVHAGSYASGDPGCGRACWRTS